MANEWFKELRTKLEPRTAELPIESAVTTSAAVSLKRIADSLQSIDYNIGAICQHLHNRS